MTYVCDTNVFDAFIKADAINDLFNLDARLIMYSDTIRNELIDPPGIGHMLIQMGLVPVELSNGEISRVQEYENRYNRLSIHDTIALSIARERNLILLT